MQEEKPKVVGQIELPKIDVLKYEGSEVSVAKVELKETKHGWCYFLESLPLEVIDTQDKKIEIKATAMFGLQKDKEGNLGWGEHTKLGEFLAKHKVSHPDEMKGKTVRCIAVASNGTNFLRIV